MITSNILLENRINELERSPGAGEEHICFCSPPGLQWLLCLLCLGLVPISFVLTLC